MSIRGSFSITPESVKEVVGEETGQVMVYGFEFTKYKHVIQALESGHHRVEKVFGATLSAPDHPEWRTTLEGSVVEPFSTNSTHESRQGVTRECKSAITALIYENYKRKKHGLPIIPFLFCIEYLVVRL